MGDELASVCALFEVSHITNKWLEFSLFYVGEHYIALHCCLKHRSKQNFRKQKRIWWRPRQTCGNVISNLAKKDWKVCFIFDQAFGFGLLKNIKYKLSCRKYLFTSCNLWGFYVERGRDRNSHQICVTIGIYGKIGRLLQVCSSRFETLSLSVFDLFVSMPILP